MVFIFQCAHLPTTPGDVRLLGIIIANRFDVRLRGRGSFGQGQSIVAHSEIVVILRDLNIEFYTLKIEKIQIEY